jgi:hypothetical protein
MPPILKPKVARIMNYASAYGQKQTSALPETDTPPPAPELRVQR